MTSRRQALSGFLTLLLIAWAVSAWLQVERRHAADRPDIETRDPVLTAGSDVPGSSGIVRFGGMKTVPQGLHWTQVSLQETWTWDGRLWRLEHPRESPPSDDSRIIVRDTERRRGVLFGAGSIDRGNETWEWDGASWQRRRPAHRPPVRQDHALAYDSNRHRTVLFGGTGTMGSYPRSLWEWDGVDWREVPASEAPPGRDRFAMVFDSTRGRSVLFGGAADFHGEKLLSDTWEWDGTTWYERNPEHSPDARYRHAMAFDPRRGVTVLFGGVGEKSEFHGDTWEWDGTDWRRVGDRGPISPRAAPLLDYDAVNGAVLLHGGREAAPGDPVSDTWLFDGARWNEAGLTQ